MSKDALLEYIEALRLRYKNATKSKKTVILNEFCETSGIERKQAIKLLNRKVGCSTRKPGPERIYSDEVAQQMAQDTHLPNLTPDYMKRDSCSKFQRRPLRCDKPCCLLERTTGSSPFSLR